MSVCIGSFVPERSALDALQVSYSHGKHMKLYSLPPNDVLHSQVICTLGVILTGIRALHHVVMIEEDDSNPVYNDINGFADVIFACDSNSLISSGKSFTMHSTDTLESSLLLGITINHNGFSFVCLKPYVEEVVTMTSNAELLSKVANMQDRPKRKRSMISPVFLKGVGRLRTQDAHDAAHVWMIAHAQDAVKIDFLPQRGERKSTSLVRRFQVKNLKDEFVVVRTLKECLEYVQGRTGRNFWDDMANDGDSYDLKSVEDLKKMSPDDVDTASSTTHAPPSHDDLFG